MATYAIGDVQGCFRTFERLLSRIGFSPRSDNLWLAGDMVNRGPRSLETLRWLMQHNDSVTAVLGNHDLYLLARHAGLLSSKRRDTLDPVLNAPDIDQLIHWIRHRPILHRERTYLMVHAGLLPEWTVSAAEAHARAIEQVLRSTEFESILTDVRRPNEELSESQRQLQHHLAVFTRIRMLKSTGEPEFMYNDAPEHAPDHLRPWFEVPHQRKNITVIFGHWAALGLRLNLGLVALDSGCVWGNSLSAYRLEDGQVFQEPFADDTPVPRDVSRS